MDISPEQTKSATGRLGSNPTVSQALVSIINWMNWFFTLTPDDQVKAGIDLSGEGRARASHGQETEWINSGGKVG